MSDSNDNHSYQEIFRGDTQHTVTEGTNTLNLRLAPLLDDRELTVPRITRINPDISTNYTAPDNDSTMKLQVRVSNELDIGVTSHFNVYVTDDIETQNTIDTNPVIENISA